MIGRLLEISIHAPDPLDVMQQFLALGFEEVPTGDVWQHRYAVVTDGAICLGLHDYAFDSPSLTFVQSDLDRWVEAYRVQNIALAFEKLDPDSFNEIGFVDPGGQMVTVLESRTFSPPLLSGPGASAFGRLRALELPCNDRTRSEAFWAQLGREVASGKLASAGLELALGSAHCLTLHYEGDALAFTQAALRAGVRGVTVGADERSAMLRVAEGPVLMVESPDE